jgi:hypothetical protein
MTTEATLPPAGRPRRLHGGPIGPLLVGAFVLAAVLVPLGLYVLPFYARSYGDRIPFAGAMFGAAIAQPISFSHRLHVTDKRIDCRYCHPTVERSTSAGLPSVEKCLGCHDHIIPLHEEIQKLRSYKNKRRGLPWIRITYNPDHVFFPHFRHLRRGVRCQECHGEVETVDRLRQETLYMGFCLACHRARGAPLTCTTCHQ